MSDNFEEVLDGIIESEGGTDVEPEVEVPVEVGGEVVHLTSTPEEVVAEAPAAEEPVAKEPVTEVPQGQPQQQWTPDQIAAYQAQQQEQQTQQRKLWEGSMLQEVKGFFPKEVEGQFLEGQLEVIQKAMVKSLAMNQQMAMQAMVQQGPMLVQQLLSTNKVNDGAEQTFFGDYPELQNKQYEPTLMAMARSLREVDPNMSAEEFTPRLARAVAAAVGVQLKGKGGNTSSQPLPRPAGAGGGAALPKQSRPKQTSAQSELDQLLDGLADYTGRSLPGR